MKHKEFISWHETLCSPLKPTDVKGAYTAFIFRVEE
jgi:hypothetical protein